MPRKNSEFMRLNDDDVSLIKMYLIQGVLSSAIAEVLGYSKPFVFICGKAIKEQKKQYQDKRVEFFKKKLKNTDRAERNKLIMNMMELGVPTKKIATIVNIAESSLRALIGKEGWVSKRREYSIEQAKILKKQILEMQTIRKAIIYKRDRKNYKFYRAKKRQSVLVRATLFKFK